MIRVHDKQLAEVARVLGLEQFEDEMVVHLREFSPRHMDVAGEDWIRRGVRLGVERAGAYGVTNPGLLRFYVELMVMFGSTFDVDPLHPWASEVLRDPELPAEEARIDRLHDAMTRYLDIVRGEGREVPLRALRNIAALFGEGITPADLVVEDRALETLARIYPERCAYLGEPRLRDLVRRAPEEAARTDLQTDRGIVVVTGWMFAIGPSFAADPFYPWIQATLRDPAIQTPERRAERLLKRSQIYVDRALEHLEGRRTDGVL